ncbi:hypothetical protein Pmani_025703 [Petrolisthes manimaculis]|uniref:Uncharacterized protein n=1 Tax=Petrolisthes manimaculis TaxID=1843537 RepID=A0AAE1P6S4_9EUCA|nr:hypothetical protein Pmani_025703 [Petrolisthes manimaculis]
MMSSSLSLQAVRWSTLAGGPHHRKGTWGTTRLRQYFSPGPSTSTDLAPVVAETPGGRPERGDTLQAPRIRLRQQTDGPVADQPYITAHTHTVNTSRFFFSFLCFCWCNYTGTCGGCLRLGGTK